jgi:hypothetical protein
MPAGPLAQLADRARKKGEPQGRWTDNEAAAEFLQSVWVNGAGTRSVRIPEGLGQVVFEDGTTAIARAALLVPSKNGLYKTAYPSVRSSVVTGSKSNIVKFEGEVE